MMEKYVLRYPKTFTLENGISLPGLDICYHASHESPGNRKVIWICHALTADSDPSGWWESLVGSGKLFNTNQYYVICANILSSCYGTTGPQSIDPKTGQCYLLNFPIVSVRDMVEAHELLRNYIGINHIDVLIGGSSGGFQALEWAIMYPTVIKNLCLLACNARFSAWGTAFNESQRMALMADPEFTGQKTPQGGRKGLECARSIALLSYRSYQGYRLTQSEDDDDCFVADKASRYQRYQGYKLGERFNPYAYYYLTLSLDTHNVGRGRGGVKKALSRISAFTLCISIRSDVLFPQQEMEEMASSIRDSRIEYIDSPYGHDAFLIEYKQLISTITKHINL